jgi:hypothetical protein
MKRVELWIDAKRVPNSSQYAWVYYMAYDTVDRNGNKQTAVLKDTGTTPYANNAKRATLFSFLCALKKLNGAVELIVHSRTQLGFKHPSKSSNSDCLMQIQAEINAAGHLISIDENEGAKNFIRVIEFEKQYGTPEGAMYYSEKVYGKDLKSSKQKQAQKSEQPKQRVESSKQSKQKVESPKPNTNKGLTPNDVFEEADISNTGSWRDMYSDLMGPSQGTWVEGSGGY